MEITKREGDGVIEVAVQGRLDGYWADHLDASLAETVREGHHHIRVNLAEVIFLSSAGIAVLMKYYKQLSRIQGSLFVLSPSHPVRLVLDLTRLTAMLVDAAPASTPAAVETTEGRPFERYETSFRLFDLEPGATLACSTIGSDDPLRKANFTDEHCTTLQCPDTVFALGVGAFGDSFADCRERFGEFLSVAGAAVYLPSDGTNVPDYLIASGSMAPEPKVLYGLLCQGAFARLARFDAKDADQDIALSDLAESCLEISGAPAAGVVMVAEASGLVGAALRRSPARTDHDRDLFAYPGVRSWLTFTAERAFARSLALVAGVVAREEEGRNRPQLRPLGGSNTLYGHFHAAAFSFRPFQRGRLDLKQTVTALFETEELSGVLHLLNDDRGAAGAGESEFIRGACWIGPIRWNQEEKGEPCSS